MNYCNRCVYPENARPGLILDEYGVCSGCRLIESRPEIDWKIREEKLIEILKNYQAIQKKKNNPYDCIVPVSGGKDSTYQVWLIKEKYKLNPLLVTYNHTFNTPLGIRNLTNLVEKLNCNLIRFTSPPQSARKLSKFMLKTVGDVTWHYHAGIQTFPSQVAVKYDIPLVIWGEEGYSELVGMYNQDDFVEFSKKKRHEHSMRGFEPDDILDLEGCPVNEYELAPFYYPSDSELEKVGVKGIYLSNFISWNAKNQTEFIIKNLGFETAQKRDRTFNLYDKLEDVHANGLHDYLKFLKFGYGRATDDASTEIRHGRMTREEGIDLVSKYDHVRPFDIDIFLKSTETSEEEFYSLIHNMRDPNIWKYENNKWIMKDHVSNHRNDIGVEEARIKNIKKQPFVKSTPKMGTRYQDDQKQNAYVIL